MERDLLRAALASAFLALTGCDPRGFGAPTDVAFLSDGTPLVSDGYDNTRVVALSADGKLQREWGEPGGDEGQLDLPHGIAVDADDRVYVANRNNARIEVFSAAGAFLYAWSGPDLGRPFGVEVFGDVVYVIDGGDQIAEQPAGRVVLLTRDGDLIGHFSGPGTGPGRLSEPHDIAVDSKGRVYVAELGTKRVQRFTLAHPP